jgi:hypothetical protein
MSSCVDCFNFAGVHEVCNLESFVFLLLSLLLAGCQPPTPTAHVPTSQSIALDRAGGLTAPVPNSFLNAIVCPPLGWKPDPPKVTANHYHQVWLSPTGDTAYGIIYFSMPLPFGLETVLWKFMSEMKKTEGEAILVSKQNDDALPGIRFIAEGGLYRIRCNLMVSGFHGWAVYAGSLRSRPVNPAELRKAELAREETRVNLP